MDAQALDGPRAKVDGAFEDFERLKAGVADFLNGNPYGVEVEYDRDTGWHTAYARIREEPPLPLSVILGEIAHDVRSAMDHIAWELAREHLDRQPAEGEAHSISFPAALSESAFLSNRTVHNFMSERAKTTVAGLQPYSRPHPLHGPSANALAVITDVWNTDKHRTLHLAFASVDMGAVKFVWRGSAANYPTKESLVEPGQPLEHNTPIARIRFAYGNAQAKVHVDPQPTAEIAFETTEWSVRLEELTDYLWYFREAVEQFKDFLPTAN